MFWKALSGLIPIIGYFIGKSKEKEQRRRAALEFMRHLDDKFINDVGMREEYRKLLIEELEKIDGQQS